MIHLRTEYEAAAMHDRATFSNDTIYPEKKKKKKKLSN